MSPPLISILIPVANGTEYLFEALASVVAQTYTCWECWVLLNGIGVCAEAEAVANAFGDPRVHVVRLDTTSVRSKVDALNAGVQRAMGEWIALLDADDRWHPTKLTEQVAAILNGPAANAIVVGTRAAYFGDMQGIPAIPVGPVATTELAAENPLINSSVLIRRAWAAWDYPPTSILPKPVMEDYYLWMRIALATHGRNHARNHALFYNVPAVLVDHRIHRDSAFNAQHDSPEPLKAWYRAATTAYNEPITILTTVCNSPHFLQAQHAALLRHMRVPWRFVVFNDAKTWPDATNFGDPTLREKLEATCRTLGVTHIPVANPHHQHIQSASHRHCDTLRAVMAWIRSQPCTGRYWMLDSDMWPVAPLEAADFDGWFADAGTFVQQQRKDIVYAWPNLWWLDTRTADITDLCWDLAPNCDTGGASAPWVQRQANRVHWLSPHLSSGTWSVSELPTHLTASLDVRRFLETDPRNTSKGCWAELYAGRIFHVRAGSGWNGEGVALHARLAELTRQHFIHSSVRTD